MSLAIPPEPISSPRAQLAALRDAIALLDRGSDAAIDNVDAPLPDVDMVLHAWRWLVAQEAAAREALRLSESEGRGEPQAGGLA